MPVCSAVFKALSVVIFDYYYYSSECGKTEDLWLNPVEPFDLN